MTLIVQDASLMTNKAAFQEALNRGDVWLHEPSVMGSWTKRASELPVGFEDVCTRMPKRDKFYAIRRGEKGWKVR